MRRTYSIRECGAGLPRRHTKVKLLDTCLSSIPQTETLSISRTVFGPSRWRRMTASVPDSPFLEVLLDRAWMEFTDYAPKVCFERRGKLFWFDKMGVVARLFVWLALRCRVLGMRDRLCPSSTGLRIYVACRIGGFLITTYRRLCRFLDIKNCLYAHSIGDRGDGKIVSLEKARLLGFSFPLDRQP